MGLFSLNLKKNAFTALLVTTKPPAKRIHELQDQGIITFLS